MHFTPHPYQSRAIEFVLEHPCAMLFLDMGLGKSVITLTALSRLIEELEVRKALIVAPKSVAEATWTAEAEKWDHLSYIKLSRVIGTPKQRQKALQAEADIYVISRDNITWLVKECRDILDGFDALILDELTSFKDHSAQRFKAIRSIRGKFDRIIGLTGTPAPNGYLDLWAQVYCIDGGERLGHTIGRYRDRYFRIENPYVTWPTYVLAPGAQTTIQEKIADIALSMQAADYLTLPERIVIMTEVCLSPIAQAAYSRFEKEQVLNVLNPQLSTLNSQLSTFNSQLSTLNSQLSTSEATILASSAAALASKLAQFANGAVYDENHVAHSVHDAKVTALLDIIEAAKSPVLVFYAFQHDVERIMAALPKHLNARLYQGADDLRAWNAGEIDVLLCHPASTAYGLNMQQGGHIIVWFGLTWNLEHYQQANARLHRQGQQQPVRIYHLVAKGTIDERTYAALADKADTQDALLQAIKQLIHKHSNL